MRERSHKLIVICDIYLHIKIRVLIKPKFVSHTPKLRATRPVIGENIGKETKII